MSSLPAQNLVVGTVEEVALEQSGITRYAVIRPVTEISEVKNVFVLTDFLGKANLQEESGASE